MQRIVVDSSGWIEYLQGTSRAALFAPAFARTAQVLVPAICIFEVHRLIATRVGEPAADDAVSLMWKCETVELDGALGRDAAATARVHNLAMADAIIYASATCHHAELWTQDAHFKNLPGVRYFPKP